MATKNNVGRPEGGNVQEKARLDSKKRVEINQECTPVAVRYKPLPATARNFRCCMCGKEYVTQSGNFLKGGQSPLWKGNGGYIPICKSCCEAIMENLTALYSGNEEHALKHICQMFDWYYDPIASGMTLSQIHHGGSRVNLYPSKMGTRQVAVRGETYIDTLKHDYESMQKVDITNLPKEEDVEEDDFVVTQEMARVWGAGYSKDQYRYLEEEYKDWTTKNVCNTKAQEELYRNIAMAQLELRIARQNGGKVSDAQKVVLDLMNSANILPRQTADNLIADTQTFGTLLKKFEENDPIPEPDERWSDVDGIRKYVNTWFRGGLAKALRVNNENAKLYEEALAEMDKYTVSPERDGIEQQGDASLFDRKEGEDGDR